MAQVGMAFAIRARALGGSGGMLLQEIFGFLDHLRVFLVHTEG